MNKQNQAHRASYSLGGNSPDELYVHPEYLNMMPAANKNMISHPIVAANPKITPVSVIPHPRERMCLKVSVAKVCGCA